MRNLKLAFILVLNICLLSSCSLFNKLKNGNTNSNEGFKKAKVVVANARQYVGSPYKYGGKTSDGFDCSGLVYISFQEAGFTLPRTSIEQANVGREITLGQVKPGDLVFFVTKKEATISHVGIVTEIKGPEWTMFIHAANTGVQEDNLYTKYYRSTFAKAMRPF